MPPITALDHSARPLLLAPSEARGWFGGEALACTDPAQVVADTDLEAAAEQLEAVFDSPPGTPVIAAALVTYEGAATVHVYDARAGSRIARGRAAARLVALAGASASDARAGGGPLVRDPRGDMGRGAHGAAVDAVREAIAAGDVYVANLTYRIDGAPALPPAAAFATLCARAGAPMSALLVADARSIASVSPERFLAIERARDGSRVAWIEPIKGTRPRGDTSKRDDALRDELLGSEKERAEHVMIVDLERNDLGRVAVPGSVRVEPLLGVFPTPYCHQMVSRVRAVLREDARLADVLEAVFPCGSVTGAPKRAAMRIIAELEASPRGAYTGALIVAQPGRLDSSVLIRTLEYHASGRVAWGTGGGVTIDSDPDAEWAETLLKAEPVLGR